MGIRSLCSIALAVLLLFAAYLALSIPAATDRTLDKRELLATINNTTNVVELQTLATAKISVLCNYHRIGSRLLYSALGISLLTAILLLLAVFSTRSQRSD